MMMGEFGFVAAGLISALLFIVPFWRILRRTGQAGPLALLLLVPVIGGPLLLAVLAFARWPAFDPPAGEATP